MSDLIKSDRAVVLQSLTSSELRELSRRTEKRLRASAEYDDYIRKLLRKHGVTSSGMSVSEVERAGWRLDEEARDLDWLARVEQGED